MKANQILASTLLAFMMGASITSCDSTDGIDDPIVLPAITTSDLLVKEKPIVNIPADRNAGNAKVIKITSGVLNEKTIVTFCDKTFAVVSEQQKKPVNSTRATSSENIVGTYTISNGKIICNFTLEEIRYTVEIPQGPVSTVTVTKNTETPENVTIKETTASTGQAISICRTWYPTQYQAVVYSDKDKHGNRKIFGNYSAPTLKQLEKIIEADTKTSINLLGGELQKFSLASDGTIVSTINNASEVYSWNWTNEGKAEFRATFGSSKEFQNLPGFVRYQAGTPNTAEFVLECEVDVKGKDKEIVKGYVEAIITAKDAK